MKNKKNIKKNYFYNLLYQVFTLITPLLTTPYVSRVLGSSGVGQYSFAYSIASYFVLFGSLGFSYYAQREVARYQGDKSEQSKIFWEVFFARATAVALSLFVYFIFYFFGSYNEYKTLMLIFSINIISVAFDIAFFFQGNEYFSVIAIRNVIIKCVGIALIFIFVKNEDDVWVYAIAHSVVLLISNLSLWTKLPRMLEKVNFNDLNIKKHYPKTFRLFIPTIAISVYTMLDKTLIGVMIPGTIEASPGVFKKISDIENGFYEQSEKLVKMATTVVGVLGSVMLPRNSNAAENGDLEELNSNVLMAFKYVFFIGCPITFGLAAVAQNMTPWFFGAGYEKVGSLIMMFAPLATILGISNVIGIQYLLPIKKDLSYTVAICSGAVINVVLNLLLIPRFYSSGAVIASVSAEICVSFLMWLMVRKDFPLSKLWKMNYKYVLSGAIMFLIVFAFQFWMEASVVNTMLLVVAGVIIYFTLLFFMRDDVVIGFYTRIRRKKHN